MARLINWDETTKKLFESGIDHCVLYPQAVNGTYPKGVAWNGITAINETPTGAEPNPQYADNIKYLNLLSAEEFGVTIEAFTFPDEFALCDGSVEPELGVMVGQQPRKAFGLCYRTLIGNDVDGQSHGYKLHLVYGAMASPSEKGYNTISDSPEAITFSWEATTTPVNVTGYQPTALITINSKQADPENLVALETILYGVTGTPDVDGRLPLPDEVLTIMGAA